MNQWVFCQEGRWWLITFCERNQIRKTATEQGDTSGWAKPPVDIKTKVSFWPGLAWPGQAKTKLLFWSQWEVWLKLTCHPVHFDSFVYPTLTPVNNLLCQIILPIICWCHVLILHMSVQLYATQAQDSGAYNLLCTVLQIIWRNSYQTLGLTLYRLQTFYRCWHKMMTWAYTYNNDRNKL